MKHQRVRQALRWTAIVVAMSIGWTVARATPLSKDDHTYLVKQTTDGCLSGQAREPANKNLLVGKIQDFCRCFGDGVVDSMQVEDLAKNQDGPSPEMTRTSGLVFNKCASSIFAK